MERRNFLSSLSALALGSMACRRPPPRPRGAPLRILMLGGTNFVGPHLVQTALDRGHEVTLFNRGLTNPHLFPGLEKLRGNRYPDRDAGLAQLGSAREWDAVIDTWQEAPGCVDLTARTLAARATRYVYISSIAAYRSYGTHGITEAGPLMDASPNVGSFDASLGYRTRKRAGEQAAERHFADRATVLRCTSILGYHHGRTVPEGYWGPRFLSGEEMLVPDDPSAVVQYIDVRDVALFAIRAIERGFGGAYNLVGPVAPRAFTEYLRDRSAETDHRSPLVWIPPAFLLERGVRPFEDIPNWIPADDPEPGFYRISNDKARAHGLTFRHLRESLRDALSKVRDYDVAAHGGLSALDLPGLPRERELALIHEWRRTASGARR